MNPRYLGDGVYASFVAGQIALSVGDHRNPPVVFLEPEVLDHLIIFAREAFNGNHNTDRVEALADDEGRSG